MKVTATFAPSLLMILFMVCSVLAANPPAGTTTPAKPAAGGAKPAADGTKTPATGTKGADGSPGFGAKMKEYMTPRNGMIFFGVLFLIVVAVFLVVHFVL